MPVKKVLTSEEQQLYNELKKLAKRANQRILRLEREFGSDTRATTLLRERLEIEQIQAWTKTGRVAVRKSMDVTQMKATIKATEQFLQNKMSTKKGIKKAKAKAIETLKIKLKQNLNIKTEDIDLLSMFFEDNDVNGITQFIPGSTISPIVEESREQNPLDYKAFYSKAISVIDYNKGKRRKIKGKNVSVTTLLKRIFKKYIFNIDIVKNMIESSATEYQLNDVKSIIDNLHNDNLISKNQWAELNYEIDKKWAEITENEGR